MTSNMGNRKDLRVPMPEIERSFFIKEEREKFKSLLLEAKDLRSGLSQTAKPLIQRVPLAVSALKVEFKKYFEPRLVAFGPLHHGNPKFEQGEQIKHKFAALFVEENDTSDEVLFDKIMVEIKVLRQCYNPKDIEDYDDEKLAWMFFMDGCAALFAVQYFSREGDFKTVNIYADLLLFFHIDLILLENQLPYRVLKILIGSTKDPQKWEQSITCFVDVMTNKRLEKKSKYPNEEKGQDYAHLLHEMRTKLLTGKEEKSSFSMIGKMLFLWCGDRKVPEKTVASIMDLEESGIHVRPTKTHNIKNISFYWNFPGILKMPPLLVDDSTASMFMNLVALESCPDFKNDFAVRSYLDFLGFLIQTAEDVKELRVRGMLHNLFGTNEEVADLFRKMSKDLVPNRNIYNDVKLNIIRYCNFWLIRIYSNYFGANWSFLAFLGAIAGLLLTLLQTYFTINPNK